MHAIEPENKDDWKCSDVGRISMSNVSERSLFCSIKLHLFDPTLLKIKVLRRKEQRTSLSYLFITYFHHSVTFVRFF